MQNKDTSSIWHYAQSWLPQVEPAFAPGRVTLGHSENEIVIRAELNDSHVMQDVFPFNYLAFTQCDTFEIFIGPADEKTYYEFHVTPSNSVLQLYLDGTKNPKSIEQLMVVEPLFTSQTSLTPDGWSVFVRIPLNSLFPAPYPEWALSFGRYDYTPGAPNPVISSTSPHAVCNFHRNHEWRRVKLADLPFLQPV